MTDQYKELREIAKNFALDGRGWAKQALKLLEEMEAVGAGGVSGKPITNGGGIGWMKNLTKGGHGMPFVDLIQGEEMVIDAGMLNLNEWVDLINRADDETKAVLRQGLKEEIELMFQRSIEVSSEHGDWIEWKGGKNPVPGCLVDFKLDGGSAIYRSQSEDVRWTREGGGDVTSYRVVK